MATKSNTRTRAGRNSLAALIVRYKAANAAYGVAATREDKVSSKFLPREYPKAFGGMTKAAQLIIAGTATDFPSKEFYYRSHEEINRAMDTGARSAKSPAARRKVASERKRLHAELSRDERRIAATFPAKVHAEARAAETALSKASKAYATARRAILNYRPNSAAEVATLLKFVASEIVDFINDTCEAAQIMRSAAEAIRRCRGSRR